MRKSSQQLCKFFIKRGFESTKVEKVRKEVLDMNRTQLLQDNEKQKRDPQTIFVCSWHPSLNKIPSILKDTTNNLIWRTAKRPSWGECPYTLTWHVKSVIMNNKKRKSPPKPQGLFTRDKSIDRSRNCKTSY